MVQRLVDADYQWELSKYNDFRPNLQGAKLVEVPSYKGGQITKVPCYVRGSKRMPNVGFFKLVLEAAQQAQDIQGILNTVGPAFRGAQGEDPSLVMNQLVQVMEVMVSEGWLTASFNPRLSVLQVGTPREGGIVHTNEFLNERFGE
jgi:hypothetical protein